jgi:hypothetical protein
MSTVITHGSDTIEPTAVEVFESNYEGGNIIHPILGREEPDVTFRDAGLSTGTLSLVFTDAAAATAALTLHRTGEVFTLTSAERPELNMSYVVAGRLARALSPSTLAAYRVRVDYQEVTL